MKVTRMSSDGSLMIMKVVMVMMVVRVVSNLINSCILCTDTAEHLTDSFCGNIANIL